MRYVGDSMRSGGNRMGWVPCTISMQVWDILSTPIDLTIWQHVARPAKDRFWELLWRVPGGVVVRIEVGHRGTD